MLLKSLGCQVSKLVNSDTCPRPTTQAPAGKPFDGRALPMRESSWYLQDTFGLRTADQQGKNHFESFDGQHIRMTDAELYGWISKYFK